MARTLQTIQLSASGRIGLFRPRPVVEPHAGERKMRDLNWKNGVTRSVSIGATVLLGLTGLDLVTSLSGSAAALANIGPGLGAIIGPSGTYAPLNDTAKWILTAAMLIGRLELMAVFVLFTRRFWMD